MNMSFQEMVDLASQGLISSGISKRAAVQTAQFLALAECDGIASHGLARVAQYVSHAKNNRIAFKSEPQLIKRHQAVALIDAGDGLAFPALRYATDLSVELAHRFGIGLVAITNSHHFGVAVTLLKRVLGLVIFLSCLVIPQPQCRWLVVKRLFWNEPNRRQFSRTF